MGPCHGRVWIRLELPRACFPGAHSGVEATARIISRLDSLAAKSGAGLICGSSEIPHGPLLSSKHARRLCRGILGARLVSAPLAVIADAEARLLGNTPIDNFIISQS